jgi:hypothetical protein
MSRYYYCTHCKEPKVIAALAVLNEHKAVCIACDVLHEPLEIGDEYDADQPLHNEHLPYSGVAIWAFT